MWILVKMEKKKKKKKKKNVLLLFHFQNFDFKKKNQFDQLKRLELIGLSQ